MEFKEAKRKDASRNPVVLAVINQKGGVGKSTTAVNLAAALGEKKYKVLLVDLDAQGNATTGVGYDKTQCEISTYNCLVDDDVKTEDAISEIKTKNVWLLPATIDLAGAETKLVDEIAREFRLSDALKDIKDEFDFILVDCPPSLGLLTVNALAAADKLISFRVGAPVSSSIACVTRPFRSSRRERAIAMSTSTCRPIPPTSSPSS